MIDIPGIYVGRFKDNPNNRSKLMTRGSVPTYTDDNWANVESTGTIWRYSSEAGEWVDTGLEEILVEEVTGTKEIVAEGTVPWKLQGLKVYGKSTQDGTPSPDSPVPIVTAGSDGSIDIAISDGADQSQQLSISTPNGLPGIPVDSGGNFTDADGQHWVCDEVDFERGVYVQRIWSKALHGGEIWNVYTNPNYPELNGFYSAQLPETMSYREGLATAFVVKDENTPSSNKDSIVFGANNIQIYIMNSSFYNSELDDSGLSDFISCLSTNSATIMTYLETPIETPLSAEELAAYAALMSYDGSTVISTDEDVSGISAKVVTNVISKNEWFDPSAELALYYKALAGFESLDNLPMPHSRESSLVRKLLDSSYELGFSVTENSSRNERYLWDLINGTTSMLTNVPKSDTEKFLHVMIGGTVEKYPTVDTELDYWMDKCVHYMNTNGSIGE